MSDRATKALLEQLIARDALARLVDDVTATGARLMPLKGVLLVALGLRKASERPMIDVDVLVSPSVARAVVQAARSHGWEVPKGNDYACVLIHPKLSSTSIDLHRALFRPHFFRMPTDEVLARGVPDEKLFGRRVVVMDRLDIYAHLVGHFAKGRQDRRHLRHLRDFGPVGRASGASPAEVAAHLDRLGLARSARYVLSLAAELERDAFAAAVIAGLPRDRRGQFLARAADRVLTHIEPGGYVGVPFVHTLNTNLASGARSLVAYLMEPKQGDDRSRDGWWLP